MVDIYKENLIKIRSIVGSCTGCYFNTDNNTDIIAITCSLILEAPSLNGEIIGCTTFNKIHFIYRPSIKRILKKL